MDLVSAMVVISGGFCFYAFTPDDDRGEGVLFWNSDFSSLFRKSLKTPVFCKLSYARTKRLHISYICPWNPLTCWNLDPVLQYLRQALRRCLMLFISAQVLL
jgi:hypothetical protein